MKKNLLFPGMLLLVGSLSLSSCGEDPAGGKSGKGSIAPLVGVDAGFLGMDVITKAGGDITTDDLSLTVTSSDGSFNQTWDSFSDFNPEEEQFPIGDYTVEVAYGDREAEGFDNKVIAAYYDSQDVKILEGAATPVELTASRTHAIVNIKYTDAFEHYIKSGAVDLISSTGNGITYVYNDDKPETRSSLIVPGRTKVLVDIEKYNGTWIHNVEAANFVTKARGSYTVTLDVNEGSLGAASLSVIIDDNVTEEVVEVDISDDVVEAPAPEIVLEGVTENGRIQVVEGTYAGDPLKVMFLAKGDLDSIYFKVESTYLRENTKWEACTSADPRGIDLISLEQGQQGKYKQNGIDCHGVWNQPGRLAVIDMTGLVNSLGYYDNDITLHNISTFIFQAKDKYSKESAPVSFSIEVLPIELSLLNPSYLKIFDTELDVEMSFNGGDPTEMVKFEYKNTRGIYDPVTVGSITHISGDFYSVHLTNLPAEERDLVLRADINGRRSPELTVPRHGVIASAERNNIFATMAFVNFSPINVSSAEISTPIFILKDGLHNPLKSTKIDDNLFLVEGLSSGETNYLNISFESKDIACNVLEIKTEEARQLDNNGMENWYSEKVYSGSTYSKDIYRWYANAVGQSFWATRNALTTSTKDGSTPYYVSYSGTQRVVGVTGYAAEISTIGYGKGSTFVETSNGGECKHTAAGMLFVGNHDATNETTESFDYGKSWASRQIG
ncbi:MAG: DUF4493 domain-containing protein, partial [Muribaculaceae bacterium]|nr:DUF4493 domain-containing protein [Muribaculaceae bacterium]